MWEYYFVHFILCQRERKRHWVVRRARPCELCFCVVDHFILGGRRPWVSKHHSDCMRVEICFKEIVSNTRLNLNHSFFMHLVYEFLIICRFFFLKVQISFYIYSIYLFIYFWTDCVKHKTWSESFIFHAFGLWVFNYLQISLYIYIVSIYLFFCLSHLFVLLLIF